MTNRSTHRPAYRESLDWIVFNDDTEFLDDPDPIPSVSVCLVADQFRKDVDEVVKDLLHRRELAFGGPSKD